MERAVSRFPNPARHVVSIASEPTREYGVALAVQEMERLHGATFRDRDAHLTRTPSSRSRRLPQHMDIPQSALQLEPECSGLFGSHLSHRSQLLLCRDSDKYEASATIVTAR